MYPDKYVLGIIRGFGSNYERLHRDGKLVNLGLRYSHVSRRLWGGKDKDFCFFLGGIIITYIVKLTLMGILTLLLLLAAPCFLHLQDYNGIWTVKKRMPSFVHV